MSLETSSPFQPLSALLPHIQRWAERGPQAIPFDLANPELNFVDIQLVTDSPADVLNPRATERDSTFVHNSQYVPTLGLLASALLVDRAVVNVATALEKSFQKVPRIISTEMGPVWNVSANPEQIVPDRYNVVLNFKTAPPCEMQDELFGETEKSTPMSFPDRSQIQSIDFYQLGIVIPVAEIQKRLDRIRTVNAKAPLTSVLMKLIKPASIDVRTIHDHHLLPTVDKANFINHRSAALLVRLYQTASTDAAIGAEKEAEYLRLYADNQM